METSGDLQNKNLQNKIQMIVMFGMNFTMFLGKGLIELYNSVWHAMACNNSKQFGK